MSKSCASMQSEECFYRILGISENATPEEIKQAYKILAKKCHPDKNQDNSEEFHEKFILLKKAFDTLSDHKERSWYDRNKASITFNKCVTTVMNPLSYRNLAAFDDFDDAPRGFFTIYRNIFEKIVQEELHFGNEAIETFPSFGYSYSTFNEVVRPFYSFWNNFCSKKSFAWVDKYDEKSCQNRYEMRAVQRENKSIRDENRKKFNSDVRSLVQFIKKRDPRIVKEPRVVIANNSKNSAQSKEQIPSANVNDFDWTTHYDNYHEDFNNIENLIEQEFSEKLNMVDSSTMKMKEFQHGVAVAEDDVIFCLLCENGSNSLRAFKNHCKTKMHSELFNSFLKNLKAQDQKNSENDEKSENIQTKNAETSSKNKQSKNQKSKTQNIPEKIQDPLTCQTCGEKFPSRNQMFKHIKEMGHGILKEISKTKKKPTGNKK